MTKPMRIDFVSDVSCPWCVVGLGGLEAALERVADVVEADIHFQPFELNPNMPREGQDLFEHVAQKYGATREQSAVNRETIRARAAEVGFIMAFKDGGRIYNTFDAHRLLHWAEIEGRQAALKRALFEAYFTDGLDPSDHDVLIATAAKAGLDEAAAREVLQSGRYTSDVRAEERKWQAAGITAVPAVVINNRHLISGGQPADVFENVIRRIAADAA